jgi:hypothetical protein
MATMKTPATGEPGSSADVSSRRRAIRLDAPANLTVALSDTQVKARVVDIGLGGICIVSNLPLKRGMTYTVTLRLGAQTASCDARAAHARKRSDGQWVVGMSFVGDKRLIDVERLVDAVTGSMIQFS